MQRMMDSLDNINKKIDDFTLEEIALMMGEKDKKNNYCTEARLKKLK